MEGEGGEVVGGEFLDESCIKVAAPWCDGVEAKASIFKHPSGESGGLGVAVAFGDGVAKSGKENQK